MGPRLLGCVLFCLLGAGESQDAWASLGRSMPVLARPSLKVAAPGASSAFSCSISFLHRLPGSRCDPEPKIPHHRDQQEGDIDLFSEYEPRSDVLVSTRPRAGPKADLLFKEH